MDQIAASGEHWIDPSVIPTQAALDPRGSSARLVRRWACSVGREGVVYETDDWRPEPLSLGRFQPCWTLRICARHWVDPATPLAHPPVWVDFIGWYAKPSAFFARNEVQVDLATTEDRETWVAVPGSSPLPYFPIADKIRLVVDRKRDLTLELTAYRGRSAYFGHAVSGFDGAAVPVVDTCAFEGEVP